jgi:hypothetical protein
MNRFNGVVISQYSIDAAKKHFIRLSQEIIKEIQEGSLAVNNKDGAIAFQQENIDRMKAGNHTSFTFWQYAYYCQTGDCAGLLGSAGH